MKCINIVFNLISNDCIIIVHVMFPLLNYCIMYVPCHWHRLFWYSYVSWTWVLVNFFIWLIKTIHIYMKLLILVTMVTIANAAFTCPQFWNLYDGSCYRYFGERSIWSVAENECNQFFTTGGNGHLASIHNVEENRFVYEMYYSSVGVSSLEDWVVSAFLQYSSKRS